MEIHAPGISIGVVGCEESGPPPWVLLLDEKCIVKGTETRHTYGGRTRQDTEAEGEGESGGVGAVFTPMLMSVVTTGVRE